jgi:hypothetical protein
MKPTVDLLAEVIDDMGETLAYAVLSPKVEEELLKALAKLKLVHSRLANPVTQQETKRYIPDNPFKRSDMRMGVVDVVLTKCVLDGEQAVIIGQNFTESSVVYADGEALETRYVSATELIVTEGDEITKGTKLYVAQVSSDMTKLARSNRITMP